MEPAAEARPEVRGDTVTTIDVGPHGLDAFLKAVQRLPGRLRYRDGRVTLVSPSYPHERGNDHLDDIVEMICDELDIDYSAAASTLYQRDDLDRGIEPDQSYYIAHQGAIHEVEKGVDLRLYPPPDLVIEVVWSHSARVALEILQAMGVPEVWLYNVSARALQFLHLDDAGTYQPQTRSRAFPFLTTEDVLEQLRSGPANEPHNRWKRRLRAWVRDVLGPRRTGT